MQKPAIPRNESLRLAELYSYNIIDSEEEKEFNDIALFAAEICGASISCISFIEKERQWFKAKYGIANNETERVFAFCSHAILQNTPSIINDTTKDIRFSNNPYVLDEPKLRFYAGFPLITPNGFNIGTIAVSDKKIIYLNEIQIKNMELLAKQTMNLLELRRKNLEILKSKSRYKDLLDNLNEGYFVDDLEGKVVFINNSFLNIFGLTQSDIVNFKIENYVDDEYLNEIKDRHNKRINGDDVATTFEYIGKKKNGDKIWVRANVSKVYEGNKIIGTQSLVTDITKEKEIEELVNQKDNIISAAFNSTTDAVCIVNKELQIIAFNSVYAEVIKNLYNLNISIGDNAINHVFPNDKNLLIDFANKCLNGEEIFYEKESEYLNNQIFWRFRFLPIKSKKGEINGISFSAKNITSKKKLEQKNSNYNDLLEAINLINSMLLDYDNVKDIYKSICDILVNIASFNMAWIGWVNEDTKQIEPAAIYGDKFNYVKNIKIYVDERPEGMGPIGIAIRTNTTQIVRNANKDERLNAWQNERSKTNWKSSIAVPINIKKDKRGILVVYSEQEDYFNHKEVLSLESIVSNYKISLDRNNLKKSLIEKDVFFNTMTNNIPAFISYWKNDLTCMFMNETFNEYFSYNPIEMIGKKYIEVFGESTYQHNKEYIANVLKGKSQKFIIQLKNTSNVDCHFLINYIPNIVNKEVLGFYSLSTDVTESVVNSKKIAFDAHILKNIHDTILISDLEGKLIFYNSVAEGVFGYKPEEVIGKRVDFIKHPDGEEKANDLYADFIKGNDSNNIWKCTTKKGDEIWMSFNSAPYFDENKKIVGVIGTGINVTENVLATKKMAFDANILANIQDSIIVTDLQGNVMYINSVTENLYGYSKEELLGKSVFFLEPENKKEDAEKLFAEIISGKAYKGIWKGKTKFGRTVWLQVTGSLFKNEKDEVIGIIGVTKDITKQKISENNLRKIKIELQTIMDNAPMQIFLKDLKGKYLLTNKNFLTNINRKGVRGLNDFNLFPKKLAEKFISRDQEIINNKKNLIYVSEFNGKHFYSIKFPVFDNDNNIFAIGGVTLDITDKLQKEKLLDELNKKYVLQQEKEQVVKIQSLIEGQEDERKRISRELHDSIGQSLSLCKLYASSLINFNGDKAEREKRLNELYEAIVQSISETRQISSNLMPAELKDFGLQTTLENLFIKINNSNSLKINYTFKDISRFSSTIEMAIFRVIQEIINNTLKHSKASNLYIDIDNYNDKLIEIETKDDGVGFIQDDIISGNGLNNIKHRVESIFGEVNITTSPKKGCSYSIKIPLDQ